MAIYAVDFDNTLAWTEFPQILNPRSEIIAWVKFLKANGARIILWTCRVGKDLEDAVKWCKEQGIEFDAVNENLPDQIEKYGNDSRKVNADFYIDDKALEINFMRNHSPKREIS